MEFNNTVLITSAENLPSSFLRPVTDKTALAQMFILSLISLDVLVCVHIDAETEAGVDLYSSLALAWLPAICTFSF